MHNSLDWLRELLKFEWNSLLFTNKIRRKVVNSTKPSMWLLTIYQLAVSSWTSQFHFMLKRNIGRLVCIVYWRKSVMFIHLSHIIVYKVIVHYSGQSRIMMRTKCYKEESAWIKSENLDVNTLRICYIVLRWSSS